MNQLNTGVQLHHDFINFKRPTPHSKFSPSAADRWLSTGCSFAVNFCQGIPEEKTSYSEEGTLAHTLCEAIFRKEFYGMELPSELLIQLAMLPDHGAEMMESAHQYVEILSFWLNHREAIGEVIFMGMEHGVPVFPEKGCFGTADFVIVGTKAAALIDFKYGRGKNVRPDTVQLKVYAAGLARYLLNLPQDYRVHVIIHQPRTDSLAKEHSYSMPELYAFQKEIWQSILNSERTDLAPVEGNHCFWCPGKRTKDVKLKCPAILEKPMKVAQENFAAFLQDMNAPVDYIGAPNPKRDEAILKLHALYPLIKQIVEDTTAEIEMRLKNGEGIPGFHIVDAIGKRELSGANESEKAELIKTHFPQVNPWKEVPATTKLRTITEIEKEIGKNKLDAVCTKKITKKVEMQSEKVREVLGLLTNYAAMIANNQE
jgi:hypothetical protein